MAVVVFLDTFHKAADEHTRLDQYGEIRLELVVRNGLDTTLLHRWKGIQGVLGNGTLPVVEQLSHHEQFANHLSVELCGHHHPTRTGTLTRKLGGNPTAMPCKYLDAHYLPLDRSRRGFPNGFSPLHSLIWGLRLRAGHCYPFLTPRTPTRCCGWVQFA
jgi:hypothetical protein